MSTGHTTRYLHEVADGEYEYDCDCGECEAKRTMWVSFSTWEHITGHFDVEKARYEVQLKKGLGPWYTYLRPGQ